MNSLEQMQQTISLLNTGFVLSIALAVIALLITALIFWRFGIWQIIQENSGRAARKAEAEFLEAANSPTAGMADKSGVLTMPSGALGERSGSLSGRMGSRRGNRKTGAAASGRLGGSSARSRQTRPGVAVTDDGTSYTTRLPSELAKQQNPDAFTGRLIEEQEAPQTQVSTTVFSNPAPAPAFNPAVPSGQLSSESPSAVSSAQLAATAGASGEMAGARRSDVADAAGVATPDSATGAAIQCKPEQVTNGFVLIKEALVVNTQSGLDD